MGLPRYRAGRNVHRLTALTDGSSSKGTDPMTWTSATQPSLSTCTTKTTAPGPLAQGYSARCSLSGSGGIYSLLFVTTVFSEGNVSSKGKVGDMNIRV